MADEKNETLEEGKWWIDRGPVKEREKPLAPVPGIIEKWAYELLRGYNQDQAAKNLVEHTGSAWEGKVVAFLAAAGGHSSYMSIMPLANSLMLDFRCVIVPRFVYATGGDFADGKVSSAKIASRITQLAGETLRLAAALQAIDSTAAQGRPR